MSNSIDRHEPPRLSDESREAIRGQRETSRVLDAVVTRSTSWKALGAKYAQVKTLHDAALMLANEMELRARSLDTACHALQADFCRAWARVLREACK